MTLTDIGSLKERIDKEVKEGKVLDGWAFFFKAYLDDAPTIDIDRPQGEWIDEADKYSASFGIHDYRCSNCNSYADEYIGGYEWYVAGKPNFCPHCGADMRERKGGKDEPQTEKLSCETCRWDSEGWYGEHCGSCVAYTDKPSNYESQTEYDEYREKIRPHDPHKDW